jgi:hypothetical protein
METAQQPAGRQADLGKAGGYANHFCGPLDVKRVLLDVYKGNEKDE